MSTSFPMPPGKKALYTESELILALGEAGFSHAKTKQTHTDGRTLHETNAKPGQLRKIAGKLQKAKGGRWEDFL
jgi:hypothetical protein